MRSAVGLATLVFASASAPQVAAHDGVLHSTPEEAARHVAETAGPPPAPQGVPLPFDLGGAFILTDQNGAPRGERDPEGAFQLLFFGYANCQSICSVALPLMADVTDGLAAMGIGATPVMVTVDPARDTVEAMGPALVAHHPAFVGLTGTEAELAPVYDLFGVQKTVVFEDPELGPIYAHGSHIYLLDGAGTVLTLLPPILSAARLTEIAAAYAPPVPGTD